jgi:hypothetical protein
MRSLEPLKYLSGSLVIYYVMAACSAPSTSASSTGGPNGGSSSGAASNGGSSGGGAPGGSSGSGSGTGGTSSGGVGGSSGSPVPDANADETQSGSRLKASYYVGADGSKQFAYFTDTARGNETCAFSTAGDGSIRCLPSGAYVIATEYSDSSCTLPVAETTTCASPPYAIQTSAGTNCGGYTTHIFAVGAPVSTFYVKSGTSCISEATPAGYTYVSVGAEIAPSSFQAATIQAE